MQIRAFYRVIAAAGACVALVALSFPAPCQARDVTITTASGSVTGEVVSPDFDLGYSKPVRQFLGIPFAKPPLGERRFRPPEMVEPWGGVHEAKQLPPACYQLYYHLSDLFDINANLSEDCLYLNVWVPEDVPRSLQPMAVMVWVYGGGFSMGSSTSRLYDGKILASQRDVIVASMQYRVGALGFMSLGTDQAPGNMGLLDQQMAFRWIKENIQAFGGDPERITIFGESAGAGSVSYHLLGSESRRYFTRAIMQSGAATALWASQDATVAKETAMGRAREVGCDSDDVDEVLKCLREREPIEVTTGVPAGSKETPSVVGAKEFLPVIDNNFIVQSPKDILSSGGFYKTEIMLGVNNDEGSLFLPIMLSHLYSLVNGSVRMNATSYRSAFDIMYPVESAAQRDAIAYRYRDWRQPNSSLRLIAGVSQAVGDTWFVCPMTEVADASVAAGQDTYVYQFTYKGSLTLMGAEPWVAGATHADEIAYVFGMPLVTNLNCSSEEKYMSGIMMTYWTNFAQTGNPNRGDNSRHSAPANWFPHTSQERQYLILTAPNPVMATDGPASAETCAFWEHYLPTLKDVHRPTDVCSPNNSAVSHVGDQAQMIVTRLLALIIATILVTLFSSLN